MNTSNKTTTNNKLVKLTLEEASIATGGACSCTCLGYGNTLTIEKKIGLNKDSDQCEAKCRSIGYYFSSCETAFYYNIDVYDIELPEES